MYCRTMSNDELEALKPELLRQHRRPNLYTLTKAVGENVVEEQRGNIPCCVVRPTLVAASYREPVPVRVFNSYIPADYVNCEIS